MTLSDFVPAAITAAQLNLVVAKVNALDTLLGGMETGVNLQSNNPSLSDFSAASMTDWITYTVPVPAAAQDGAHLADFAFWANPFIITAAGTFAFRIVVAAFTGTTFGGFQQPAASSTITVAIGSGPTPYTIPGGTTSMSVKVQAQRTAGTGAIRANSTNNFGAVLLTTFHT